MKNLMRWSGIAVAVVAVVAVNVLGIEAERRHREEQATANIEVGWLAGQCDALRSVTTASPELRADPDNQGALAACGKLSATYAKQLQPLRRITDGR